MSTSITPVIEDFLSIIYRLEEIYGFARTTDIAKTLKISPGSVVNILKKLSDMGLINYSKYKGIRLTDDGRKIAEDVIKKHRLVERLLVDIIGVDEIKAHIVAHKLEHHVEDILEDIARVLENPDRCPHGNPISPKVSVNEICLVELEEGSTGIIVRIANESTDILNMLKSNSIWIGVRIKVIKKSHDSILVDTGEKSLLITNKIARGIFVHGEERCPRSINSVH